MFTCLYRNGRFLSKLCEEETYREFGDLIILYLKKFGIEGKRRRLNDVVVKDRKIFGSSFTKIGDSISFTGTILVDKDLEFLSKVLKFIELKFSDKKFSNLNYALTTISIELDRKVKIKESFNKFIKTFKEKFNVEIYKGKIYKEKKFLMKKLYDEECKKKEWTFGFKKDYEEFTLRK